MTLVCVCVWAPSCAFVSVRRLFVENHLFSVGIHTQFTRSNGSQRKKKEKIITLDKNKKYKRQKDNNNKKENNQFQRIEIMQREKKFFSPLYFGMWQSHTRKTILAVADCRITRMRHQYSKGNGWCFSVCVHWFLSLSTVESNLNL